MVLVLNMNRFQVNEYKEMVTCLIIIGVSQKSMLEGVCDPSISPQAIHA
jgi:hypothetical protein